jgi:hypothetical protein
MGGPETLLPLGVAAPIIGPVVLPVGGVTEWVFNMAGGMFWMQIR